MGGLALLGVGCCFPPAMPALGALAGAMIGEGITDLVMDIIS